MLRTVLDIITLRLDPRTLICGAILVASLPGAMFAPAMAQSPPAPSSPDTAAAIFAAALHQATGAPAQVGLGDQATVRLSNDLMFIPAQAANKLLLVNGQPAHPDMLGLLTGSDGLDIAGPVRFVPAGFIDADTMRAWTPDDILASLRDSVEHANADRLRKNQPELEARSWVQPPRYDPGSHQLAWAALIVPKSAPRGSDGEVVYHAIAFGRDGFIQLTIAASLEQAEPVTRFTTAFLNGLTFQPGKRYQDVMPQDHHLQNGLARAIGLDTLHKANSQSTWGSEVAIPAAGGLVAAIGVISLVVYLARRTRQEARRG